MPTNPPPRPQKQRHRRHEARFSIMPQPFTRANKQMGENVIVLHDRECESAQFIFGGLRL